MPDPLSPIVLIHPSVAVTQNTLTLLRKRGLIPIICDDPEKVQMVAPAALQAQSGAILRAAAEAIYESGGQGSDTRREFARVLCGLIAREASDAD